MIRPVNTPLPGRVVVPCNGVVGQAGGKGKVYEIDRWLTHKLMLTIGEPPISVTLWDGKELKTTASPAAGMVIHDRRTLWRLLTNPLLHFGDDYSAGRIEIEGKLTRFLETVYPAMTAAHRFRRSSASAAHRRNQPNRNSIADARLNIHHHYDISNDFYRLWLDKEMLYTCAYFPEEGLSLEDAQRAKMDLVCRKLRLQPGQTVVEAGCGWGGLARHMARYYGVNVRAYNISHEQIVYARQRLQAENLHGLIEYIEDDYRNISGSCDAFVSVGMLEHVGPDHYQELGRVIDRCLTDNGVGLIHTIGQNSATPMSPWFLKRMFPGSYPPTIREMMAIFEPGEFTILDLENLRLHYARTCEHWLDRFEQKLDRVQAMFDESFSRAWRLYLSGCIANFNIGKLQLFQVLFCRATNNLVPWTRAHMIDPVCEP